MKNQNFTENEQTNKTLINQLRKNNLTVSEIKNIFLDNNSLKINYQFLFFKYSSSENDFLEKINKINDYKKNEFLNETKLKFEKKEQKDLLNKVENIHDYNKNWYIINSFKITKKAFFKNELEKLNKNELLNKLNYSNYYSKTFSNFLLTKNNLRNYNLPNYEKKRNYRNKKKNKYLEDHFKDNSYLWDKKLIEKLSILLNLSHSYIYKWNLEKLKKTNNVI